MRKRFPATIELNLTKKDLNGQYHDTEDCPVARACRRFAKCKEDEIGVGGFTVDFYQHKPRFSSLAIYEFVEKWDHKIHNQLLESLKAGKFKGHKITLKRIR